MEKMKVYTCFPGGKAKALTMSYDDGKVQDRRLIDIFNKYGIKGTFNLNYGQVGERPRMTFEEMEGLYAGHEIATHTMTHPTIERCPLVEVAQELLEDIHQLQVLSLLEISKKFRVLHQLRIIMMAGSMPLQRILWQCKIRNRLYNSGISHAQLAIQLFDLLAVRTVGIRMSPDDLSCPFLQTFPILQKLLCHFH